MEKWILSNHSKREMEVFFYAFLHEYDNFYTSNQFNSVFFCKNFHLNFENWSLLKLLMKFFLRIYMMKNKISEIGLRIIIISSVLIFLFLNTRRRHTIRQNFTFSSTFFISVMHWKWENKFKMNKIITTKSDTEQLKMQSK